VVTAAAEHEPGLSEALEDCLREIYKLEAEAGQAANSAIADRLDLSPSSTTAMVKRLAALGLVTHTRYRGTTLTDAGMRAALGLVRRHRLLERFLTDTLGVDLSDVHREADRLEHRLSPALQERIADMLGHPDRDPHGDPIPGPDLSSPVSAAGTLPLTAIPAGQEAVVHRIPGTDDALVSYLAERGLVPGATVAVVEVSPFDGPMVLRIDANTVAVNRSLAETIAVDGSG
jgi:DtxR family transcriptional regulator, Mn-dependent transcriptional regulator